MKHTDSQRLFNKDLGATYDSKLRFNEHTSIITKNGRKLSSLNF